ncbi:hypothetical protein [Aureliella helgolandensis]|uniref:Uncharacterized protein n=1 Tax=Aureliella helgolandensis TaxID=2527968 RepID=A0A518G212_9BACT|nr:hypothetical protein [Aureliella helgolandensis]QDV22614.1 hypothetical protein Q31a_09000 [Aureliella helgolandensis]
MPALDSTPSHWDLLLAPPLPASQLITYQLLELPDPNRLLAKIGARRLPDHRPLYLDYEGPISRNRGSVTRYAAGTYTIASPPQITPAEFLAWSSPDVVVQPTPRTTAVRISIELQSQDGWTAKLQIPASQPGEPLELTLQEWRKREL